MSDVPVDLLPEILSRLPVTPLLRFRCVCKSWKGLIDSNQFINDHLNHSQKSNSNLNIILRFGSLYSEDLDMLTTNEDTFPELSHPLNTPHCQTDILGSCNGLLVLSNGEDDIILWNPSIRRFHNIPVTSMGMLEYYHHVYIVYGFGYDFRRDDYKLVRIVQYYAKGTVSLISQVKVYSVNRNSWEEIADFPYYLCVRRGGGEFVNGALHWVVGKTRVMDKEYDNVDCLLAAFDLETEDYRLVSLPEFEGDDFQINVGVLGGCLIIVCNYYTTRDQVDIWVMKDYGVKESWSVLFTLDRSNLFTITHSDMTFRSLEYCDVVMPIAYSDCGRKVMLRWNNCIFLWYDLDKKSGELPTCQIDEDKEDYVDLHTCLKSLVLLNNGICDGDFDIVTKNEEEKKSKLSRRARFMNSWFNHSGKGW